jgi:hypothetical protein
VIRKGEKRENFNEGGERGRRGREKWREAGGKEEGGGMEGEERPMISPNPHSGIKLFSKKRVFPQKNKIKFLPGNVHVKPWRIQKKREGGMRGKGEAPSLLEMFRVHGIRVPISQKFKKREIYM